MELFFVLSCYIIIDGYNDTLFVLLLIGQYVPVCTERGDRKSIFAE